MFEVLHSLGRIEQVEVEVGKGCRIEDGRENGLFGEAAYGTVDHIAEHMDNNEVYWKEGEDLSANTDQVTADMVLIKLMEFAGGHVFFREFLPE